MENQKNTKILTIYLSFIEEFNYLHLLNRSNESKLEVVHANSNGPKITLQEFVVKYYFKLLHNGIKKQLVAISHHFG